MRLHTIATQLNNINSILIRRDEPMKLHTSFGIGGPADVFVQVESEESLLAVLDLLRDAGADWFLLGDGANLLVSDRGIRGVVIKLGEFFKSIQISGLQVIAGAAVRVSDLADTIAQNALAGFEGVGGVPGCLGGAIVMNAGTHRGYIGDIVDYVKAVNPEGQLISLKREDCRFAYRSSRFQYEQGNIITSVAMTLRQGDSESVLHELKNIRTRRNSSLPQGRSAGCFFKNPLPESAGKLIEGLGLKGLRVGDAVVADRHANFIVNEGNASAADVLNLAESVRQKVYETHGIELEFEVRVVGDWE